MTKVNIVSSFPEELGFMLELCRRNEVSPGVMAAGGAVLKCAVVRTLEAAQRRGLQSKSSPGMYFLFEHCKDVFGIL